MSFYEQLKQFRKRKGYTIREVSDRSGVSAAYISQLENGNRGVPSPDILLKLSEGLNIPYAELMRIAGYLEECRELGTKQEAPINLRRLLRDNEVVFDGMVLNETQKEWVERILSVLFWYEKQNRS